MLALVFNAVQRTGATMAKRLITLRTIQGEHVNRSRSWILAELAAGRFPQPAVRGNPNLWDSEEVEAWVVDFIASHQSLEVAHTKIGEAKK